MLHNIKGLMIKWLSLLVMKVLGVDGKLMLGGEEEEKRPAATFILCVSITPKGGLIVWNIYCTKKNSTQRLYNGVGGVGSGVISPKLSSAHINTFTCLVHTWALKCFQDCFFGSLKLSNPHFRGLHPWSIAVRDEGPHSILLYFEAPRTCFRQHFQSHWRVLAASAYREQLLRCYTLHHVI